MAYAYGSVEHIVSVLNTVRTDEGQVSPADPDRTLNMLVVAEYGKENAPY